MKNTKSNRLKVSELILVKCGNDWSRTYLGNIVRSTDGSPTVYGKVVIDETTIMAMGDSEEDLTAKLDEMCFMLIFSNLHNQAENEIN